MKYIKKKRTRKDKVAGKAHTKKEPKIICFKKTPAVH